MQLATVNELVSALRRGELIVLTDAEDRENEGDLVCLAESITPENINFMITHGRGLVCLPMSQAHAVRLGLEPMTNENECAYGTKFTVSIEAKKGVTTGISAFDRATTIATACDPTSRREHLAVPGHVFPIIAEDDGVLSRPGHTEAVCDLAELAGSTRMAVLCEILSSDGRMARFPELQRFAQAHGLKMGTIQSLIEYRLQQKECKNVS